MSSQTLEQYLYFHGRVRTPNRGFGVQGASAGLTSDELADLERLSFFRPISGSSVAFARRRLASGRITLQRKVIVPSTDGRYLVHGVIAEPSVLTLETTADFAASAFWISSDAGEYGADLPLLFISDLIDARPTLRQASMVDLDVLALITRGQVDFGTGLDDSLLAISTIAPNLLASAARTCELEIGESSEGFGTGRQHAFSRATVDPVEEDSEAVRLVLDHVRVGGRFATLVANDESASYQLTAALTSIADAAAQQHTIVDHLLATEPGLARAALVDPLIAETLVHDLRRLGGSTIDHMSALIEASHATPRLALGEATIDDALAIYAESADTLAADGSDLPAATCALILRGLVRDQTDLVARRLDRDRWPWRVLTGSREATTSGWPPQRTVRVPLPALVVVALWRLDLLRDPAGEAAASIAERPDRVRELRPLLADPTIGSHIVSAVSSSPDSLLALIPELPAATAVRFCREHEANSALWRAIMRRQDVTYEHLVEGCETLADAIGPIVADMPVLADLVAERWADEPVRAKARFGRRRPRSRSDE